jgi:uncharacterized membrane protein
MNNSHRAVTAVVAAILTLGLAATADVSAAEKYSRDRCVADPDAGDTDCQPAVGPRADADPRRVLQSAWITVPKATCEEILKTEAESGNHGG